MGNRLSKIYTRTGDDGTTGLGDGSRVPKDSVRVEAYGSVDELNSALGVLLAVPELPRAVTSCLLEVQHELFDMGGELCIPGHTAISAAQVTRLEQELDAFNDALPALKEFILPGGGRLPPGAHHRAARRAARVDAGAAAEREPARAAVPEPPLGPAVRDRARAGAPRARHRGAVAPRALEVALRLPRGAPPARHAAAATRTRHPDRSCARGRRRSGPRGARPRARDRRR